MRRKQDSAVRKWETLKAAIVEAASPRPVPLLGEPGFWKTTTFWTAALALGLAAAGAASHFSGVS